MVKETLRMVISMDSSGFILFGNKGIESLDLNMVTETEPKWDYIGSVK